MKTPTQRLIPALTLLLLAACSGGDSGPATSANPVLLASVQHSSAQQVSAASYDEVVQRLYVAYFGRPADPAGLAYFKDRYLAVGSPTDIVGLGQAYNTNSGVKDLIDSFATSQESQDLYPGDNSTFLNAIYHNLFNRDPDDAGRAYWLDLLNRGAMTRSNAAISIMAGAQSSDSQLIAMKVKAASDFTNALDTPVETAAYDGLAANVVVRAMLAGVTLATDVNNFQGTINSTITTLVNAAPAPTVTYAQVATIIQQRCAGCHSSQPTIPGFGAPPAGIYLDTSAAIHANAALINSNAVQTRNMPYGNITKMTDDERSLVGQWFALGAP